MQTVMLSGMGGDEIFGGYPRQMAMKLAAGTDLIPSAVRRPLMHALDSLLPGGAGGRLNAPLRNAKKFARSAALDFEDRYLGFGTYFSQQMKRRLLTTAFREQTHRFDPYAYHKACFAKCRNGSPVNRMLYVDFKTFMPALNLDTTDKASMAANLEVRVPFLNRDLVELSARIPASLKIKGLKRKYILKKAVEQILPHDVIWRRKAGFGAPVRSWLRGQLRPMVDDLLSDERLRARGIFEPSGIREIIDANTSGREDYSLQIFQLLNFELWMQQFIDGPGK
jgi:asparagine synthase (glutamine-hydrolysing)